MYSIGHHRNATTRAQSSTTHANGQKSSLPCASLRGYHISQLPSDIIAAAVVTALTLPIAMGYADIVGLPAIYGLYASIVSTLVFALVTATKHLVFGMDSAASAATGTTLAAMGLALGTQQIVDVMPLLTLLTALFLLLFWLLRAGKLVRYVPSPVMHGFIAGISAAVVIAQIPTLLGTGYTDSSAFPFGTIGIFSSIPNACPASVGIAAVTLALLIVGKRFAPKLPASLIVIVIATAATGLLALDSHGVAILGAVESGLPLPTVPKLDTTRIVSLVAGAFSIAVVITIESLLCLETFSIRTGERASGNREMLSFAVANAAAGIFGCPPCSASISRTAAGMDAGGNSQLVSAFAALFVSAVLVALSPLLYYLPRPALSAVVVMALISVVDFKKIASYAHNVRLEFGVFLCTAAVVFVWGAIAGVAVGILLSFAVMHYRDKRASAGVLLGLTPSSSPDAKSAKSQGRPDPGVPYSTFALKGRLTFANIDQKIDRIQSKMDSASKAVILKMSKVTSIDATATDKLVQFISMLHAQGMHVKLVRKVRPTDDSYTRHELREVLGEARVYPNMREALAGIQRDFNHQRIETDIPFLTIVRENETESSKTFSGRIRFLKSEQKLLFHIVVNLQQARGKNDEAFSALEITDSKTEDELVRYHHGTWTWHSEDENLARAVRRLRAFAEKQA